MLGSDQQQGWLRQLHSFDKAAGLALAAEVGDALVGADERDGGTAARAGLARLHVHGHKLAWL